MSPFSQSQSEEIHCAICQYPGVDVCFIGCSCQAHARCIPVDTIISEPALARHDKQPVGAGDRLCPGCNMSPVSGFRLLPMTIGKINRAVALRKQEALRKQKDGAHDGNNGENGLLLDGGGGGVKLKFADAQAEASYLLLSHGGASLTGGTSSSNADNDYQRTGRWTDEEVAYTDFLVEAFDSGRLPIEHGTKLSDFLSEVLLCKSSRLTKKMKNAKLSVRSYEFRYPILKLDVQAMSVLQHKFLHSIASEASRLELSFNLTRLWRSHLSNLCLQVGSPLLDATDWIASLESMESRAAQAEEAIRKAKRKRMGLALKKDVRAGNNGVFFAGMPVQRPPKRTKSFLSSTSSTADHHNPGLVRSGASITDASSTSHHSGASSEEGSDMDFVRDMLDFDDKLPANADDYARIMEDLVNGPGLPSTAKHTKNNCGPFLEEIISYAERHDLPFQHVDVWVPSYSKTNNGTEKTHDDDSGGAATTEELRLYHAGFATRTDVDSALFGQLNEYGEYSSKFSFGSGAGLPGRVFESGGPRWERSVHEADPTHFERAGGAKVYGVKTGFGFPLTTKVIGRIVVCFYSVEDVPEDHDIAGKCVCDLAKLCPEPKWKLVVDMAPESVSLDPHHSISEMKPPSSISSSGFKVSQTPTMMHYDYSPVAADTVVSSNTTTNRQQIDDASVLSSSTRRSLSGEDEGLTDHKIATLLGDHMPLSELPAPGQPFAPAAPSLLVPHFMSLRLLLLRPVGRRSTQDNDNIEVIRNSYRGYTRDGRRSDKELAHLVVKDWQFLRASQPAPEKTTRRSVSTGRPRRPVPSFHHHQSNNTNNKNTGGDLMSVSTTASGPTTMMLEPLPFINSRTEARRASCNL